ncbi:hypothetical protein HAX54_047974, partial [Datura stramonium]|nr:hypothetical protein [Datura stramonium]
MANPVAQLNIPQKDITEAQRDKVVQLAEKAQLADTIRRVDAAQLVTTLVERNRQNPLILVDVMLYGMCSSR